MYSCDTEKVKFLSKMTLASLIVCTSTASHASVHDVVKPCAWSETDVDWTHVYYLAFQDYEGNFDTGYSGRAQNAIKDDRLIDLLNVSKSRSSVSTVHIGPFKARRNPSPSHFDFRFEAGKKYKIAIVTRADHWRFYEPYDSSDTSTLTFELKNASSASQFCGLEDLGVGRELIRFYYDAATAQAEHEFNLNLNVISGRTKTKITVDPKIIND